MITKNNTEIGIKPELDISSAIRDFTNALVETVHYKNYESASTRFKDDQEAQKAYQEYLAAAESGEDKAEGNIALGYVYENQFFGDRDNQDH